MGVCDGGMESWNGKGAVWHKGAMGKCDEDGKDCFAERIDGWDEIGFDD